MTFSDIVGLKVISVFDKKILGYVIDALYNRKSQKITELVVSDKLEETTKILNVKHILNTDNQFVLIANSTALVLCEPENPMCGELVNKLVLNVNGENFEKVKTINIDEKFYVKSIESERKTFLIKDIYGVGDIVFLKDETRKKQRNFTPRRKIEKPKQAQEQVVSIEPTTPTPVKVQPNGLIGKRLKRDFVVFGNRILARRNSTITNDLILTAKRLNVLPELELLSF